MFAPRIPKTKAKTTSATVPTQLCEPAHHTPGRAANSLVERLSLLQGTIGNQAVLRLLTQRSSGRSGTWPDDQHEQAGVGNPHFIALATHSVPADGATVRRICADRPTARQVRPPLAAPPVIGSLQRRVAVGRLDDPLEHEADRAADRAVRIVAPETGVGGGGPLLGRKCSTCEEQETVPLRFKRVPDNDAAVCRAPPAADEAVSSPGQPLDADMQAFMEARFDHDFSTVRVHCDARAAESANAVNARAYVVGNDIVFGQDEYDPGTTKGKWLIAHELVHVVQQQNSSNFHPALQRAAKKAKTSAGEFVADPYDAMVQPGYRGIVTGYGADITIKFKANERVDAEKIAFVQTALSVKDDKVHNKYEGEKKKVAESRMLSPGKSGAGVHIDQLPDVATPLYGMAGNRGDDLANPEPHKRLTTFGWHYKNARGKLENEDAMMHDEPDLTSGDRYTAAADVMNEEWHQRFETTALAIAGNQKGTFYGSVEWGWTKSVADLYPNLLDFKVKSENVPSPIFMEAARLWNVSVTTRKTQSIDVPVDVHITSESAQLWDSPDQRRKVATLTRNTPLGRTARVDPKGRTWWASVIVIEGPNAGKAGWVKELDLH